jgi:hypothetical protein
MFQINPNSDVWAPVTILEKHQHFSNCLSPNVPIVLALQMILGVLFLKKYMTGPNASDTSLSQLTLATLLLKIHEYLGSLFLRAWSYTWASVYIGLYELALRYLNCFNLCSGAGR